MIPFNLDNLISKRRLTGSPGLATSVNKEIVALNPDGCYSTWRQPHWRGTEAHSSPYNLNRPVLNWLLCTILIFSYFCFSSFIQHFHYMKHRTNNHHQEGWSYQNGWSDQPPQVLEKSKWFIILIHSLTPLSFASLDRHAYL